MSHPTAAQEAYLLGDDSKWEEAACKDGFPNDRPVEIALAYGRTGKEL